MNNNVHNQYCEMCYTDLVFANDHNLSQLIPPSDRMIAGRPSSRADAHAAIACYI
jgi:hypothetical protein